MLRSILAVVFLFYTGVASATDCDTFKRGDANGSGTTDQSDAVYLIDWLTDDGDPPTHMDAGDANDDGSVNLSDAIYILNWLNLGSPAPDMPFDCFGLDPTPDTLVVCCDSADGGVSSAVYNTGSAYTGGSHSWDAVLYSYMDIGSWDARVEAIDSNCSATIGSVAYDLGLGVNLGSNWFITTKAAMATGIPELDVSFTMHGQVFAQTLCAPCRPECASNVVKLDTSSASLILLFRETTGTTYDQIEIPIDLGESADVGISIKHGEYQGTCLLYDFAAPRRESLVYFDDKLNLADYVSQLDQFDDCDELTCTVAYISCGEAIYTLNCTDTQKVFAKVKIIELLFRDFEIEVVNDCCEEL